MDILGRIPREMAIWGGSLKSSQTVLQNIREALTDRYTLMRLSCFDIVTPAIGDSDPARESPRLTPPPMNGPDQTRRQGCVFAFSSPRWGSGAVPPSCGFE